MNPDHLIKAAFVSELVADSWTSGSDRNFNGASISTLETLPNQWDPYFDLSDRATFLLALDVLNKRNGPESSLRLDSDDEWECSRDDGKAITQYGWDGRDPIHALKLSLEATAEKP